jgi:outer membrane lipoprotein-sorting protein
MSSNSLTMTLRSLVSPVSVLFALMGLGLAQDQGSPETKRVLAKMDEASKRLSDLTADIKMTKVTVVVDDKAEETGKLYYQRGKKGSRTRLDYLAPEVKTLILDKGKVELYEPNFSRMTEFPLGKNRAEAEFFSIGFGPTGNLTRSYDVSVTKEEALRGIKTSLLELKPKSSGTMFKGIMIWVDHVRWIPIQMQLIEASGDYLSIQFENIVLNPNLNDKTFHLNLPSGVQRVKAAVPH